MVKNDDFRMIDDRKVIAKEYLKGWFTIDFFAVIPFNDVLT